MNSGFIVAGLDCVCAALTLVYIARLLFQSSVIGNPVGASCSVAKVSLRGQQIGRRVR
jgi:hypothetical protein